MWRGVKVWRKEEIGALFLISTVIGFLIRLFLAFTPLTILEVEERVKSLNSPSFGPLATVFYSLLPNSPEVYRMLGILAFLASSALIYLITREYSHRAAEIAVMIFSLEPHSIVYYSYGFPASFALTFALATYYVLKRGIGEGNPGYFLLAGILLGVFSYFSTFVMTFFLFLGAVYLLGILIKMRGISEPLGKLRRLYERRGVLEHMLEREEYSNRSLLSFKLEKVEERIREEEEEIETLRKSLNCFKYAVYLFPSMLATSLAIFPLYGMHSLYMSLFGYIPQIFGAFPLSYLSYGQGALFLHLLIYSPIFLLFSYIVLFEDVYLEAGAGLAFLAFILANPSSSPWNYLFPLTMMIVGASPVIWDRYKKLGLKKGLALASTIIIAFTLFQGAITIYGCEMGSEELIIGQVHCIKELEKAYSYYTTNYGEIPTFRVYGLPSKFLDVLTYLGYKTGPPEIVVASPSAALNISSLIKNSIEAGPFKAISLSYQGSPLEELLSPSYVFLRAPNHIKSFEAYIFILRRGADLVCT